MSLGHPSPPPDIVGYTYLRDLGAGGYSQVYLYEQHMPRREVAVKVMNTDMGETSSTRFEQEANLMARVSSHPAIVSVFGAGVSADGRPFLVMEHCPPPHLNMMLKQGPLDVAEALRIAIQIAGAVETAHRVGIVHRDIKPANILFTSYRRPVLSDFGISMMSGPHTDAKELRGMSVPWAPPEQIAGARRAEPTSDVYSLAATTYAMLAGHSPFEIEGASDDVYDLARRIVKDPVPPLGRPDLPPSLYRVLRIAMDKDPGHRYPSALAFARALQQVEGELGLPITTADLYQEADNLAQARRDIGEDPGATRLGVFSRPEEPESPDPPPIAPEGPRTSDRRSARRRILTGAASVIVVALVVLGAVNAARSVQGSRPDATFATLAPGGSQPLGTTVPVPRDVQGVANDDGTVTFSWTEPEQGWTGSYLFREDVAGSGSVALERTESTSAVLTARPGSTCIEVYSLRTDGKTSAAARRCVDTP